MVLLDAVDKMADHILSQESYGRRYAILGNYEMINLFWKHSKAYDNELARIGNLGIKEALLNYLLNEIDLLHREYNDLYRNVLVESENTNLEVLNKYDNKIRAILKQIVTMVKKIELETRAKQWIDMKESRENTNHTYRITTLLLCLGILFGFANGLFIIRNIIRTIRKLKLATQDISQGKFNHIFDETEPDVLGGLFKDFTLMSQNLATMDQESLESNPLTHLPGGNRIDNILKTKLKNDESIAFCLLDLDNFKSYNDRYGYARGNEVIKATCGIIQKAVLEYGSKNDFVGHIGGDDFAILSTPGRHINICQRIIKDFDRMITKFYSPKDIANGYIVSKSRQGYKMRFPIMTISIAAVINEKNVETNHIKIAEIAAELKEHAKSFAGSILIKDRREEIE
jgi:diguanylate cyclase (GGDEF)-like protein